MVGLGELVPGHFTQFEDEPDRVPDAGLVVQQRIEVVRAEGAMAQVGDQGLRQEVLAQAVATQLLERLRGESADGVGRRWFQRRRRGRVAAGEPVQLGRGSRGGRGLMEPIWRSASGTRGAPARGGPFPRD